MMRCSAGLLALLLLLPSTLLAADARQWKMVSDRDGIQVYSAHTDDARIKTFRGITVIELDDFYTPIAVLDNDEYLTRWLYMIHDLHEIGRRSPVDRDYYVLTKLPWPVADRDAGLLFTVAQDPQTHEIQIVFTARDGIVPRTDKYIRIPEMIGHFNVLPVGGKKVQLNFEVQIDLGGYIPAFLVNFILKDIPYVSLQRLRRIINTDVFKGRPVDYIKAPPPWATAEPVVQQAPPPAGQKP